MIIRHVALVTLLAGSLAGCSTSPKISSAVVNGYSLEKLTGTVNMNVSAFDGAGKLLTQGNISGIGLTGLSITSSTYSSVNSTQSTVTGTGTLCGNIASPGPVNAVITLDATGSMSYTDPQHLRAEAARQFISRMSSLDQAAVSSFESGNPPTQGFRAIRVWQGFTADHSVLDSAVASATYEGGSTPLWDASYDAAELLDASGGNRIALILTDGGNNEGRARVEDAISQAKSRQVKLFMVGLGATSGIDLSDMQRAAFETGGVFARADDPSGLSGVFNGMFNASKASGCIRVVVRIDGNPPPPGAIIAGKLNFRVDGTDVSAPFTIDF